MTDTIPYTILALDIGNARIGVARANSIAKLPEPVTVLPNNTNVYQELCKLFDQHGAKKIVVGLPLTDGEKTPQSETTQEFVEKLKEHTTLPVAYCDESYTSKLADQKIGFKTAHKQSNDAEAACYILERYFTEGSVVYV